MEGEGVSAAPASSGSLYNRGLYSFYNAEAIQREFVQFLECGGKLCKLRFQREFLQLRPLPVGVRWAAACEAGSRGRPHRHAGPEAPTEIHGLPCRAHGRIPPRRPTQLERGGRPGRPAGPPGPTATPSRQAAARAAAGCAFRPPCRCFLTCWQIAGTAGFIQFL